MPGCALRGRWFDRNPYGPHAPCQLPAEVTVPDLVQHINVNSLKLSSWRAFSVRISSRGPVGFPVSIAANLAVEAPRNLRLTANSPGGPELDIGSNAEQFWFWSRRSEDKYVFTARHDQLARAQQRFPIPFQPDWLIEALGVIQLNEREVALEPGPPGSRRASLISERTSPQGQPVRKVMVVDTCHGLILEHALYDASNRLLARAVLSGHIRDPYTQAVLPGRIDLEWPPAKMSLVLELGPIEANPALPQQLWTVPTIPDYPALDLGR